MRYLLIVLITYLSLSSCTNEDIQEINIGFIGPLTERAIDLGIGPSKSLELAVKEYNENRPINAPQVNLYIEDDKWEKENAIPAYKRLREQHNIDLLFMSNTGGTVALQDNIINDKVILVNLINNDAILSKLNRNTFKIAKRTEDAHEIIGARIAELDLKNILILHFPNDFMTLGTNSVADVLKDHNINYSIITAKKGQTEFKSILEKAKAEKVDGICFFGYRNFGFAMKQARKMGINAQFFGSTTLFDPIFYKNSEGHIVGTECTYFTESDGNYVLAHQFIKDYQNLHQESPISIWPAMQAYDAGNIVLQILKAVNSESLEEPLNDWLRKKIHRVNYYQGICGNISIGPDGASKGIYFSNYQYGNQGKPIKIKR